MSNPTETINMYQVKQAQSLAELLGYIPAIYFEKVLLWLLGFFVLSPIVMIVLLNLGITIFNPYYILLQMGYVGMIVASLLLYKRRQEKEKIKREELRHWASQYAVYLCLAGVLVWGILATLFSSDFVLSFYGDYYRKEGLLTIGAYAGIFMAAAGIHNEKLKTRLIEIFVLASFVMGMVVLFQWLGWPIKSVVYQFGVNDGVAFVPWGGIFHNVNHYGYYLTMAIMAASGLFAFEQRKPMTVLYMLAFGLLTWVLIENNTFGAYLGVCAGLFLLLGVGMYRKDRFKRSLILVMVFVVISLLVNGRMGLVKNNMITLGEDIKSVAQVVTEDVEETSSNKNLGKENNNSEVISQKDAVALATRSGFGRWILWTGAVKIIKEHPIFGVGPDNLAAFYDKMGITWDRPHNEFLQIGASLGIPALILYLSGLGIALAKIFKNLKKMSKTGIIAFCAVGGYLVSAMFGNTMYYTYPYFLMFLAIALTGVQKPVMEVTLEPNQPIPVSP